MVLDADATIEAVHRADWGRIVATLIRLVGDFDLAEEVAQEAFAAALDQWRQSPEFPILREHGSSRPRGTRRSTASVAVGYFEEKVKPIAASGSAATEPEPDDDATEIADDRLRLIFTCCHPALRERHRLR